ncbi:MAG TPA: PAS domain S-box protein [Sphingomicrobium sp.]|nr:PAS domain S-box protein [Sphingomicrobium sp.]
MANLVGISEEQRFRLLVGAVTDYAIYMLDPDGLVTTWNPGAERIKGYSADEIIGQHFSRFFAPEDLAADLPGRALRTAARDGRFEAEGWRVRKDGTQLWVHAIIDPIVGDEGELLGFAKITRDITERKQAQDQLEEAREALAQSQRLQALGELTGGIAHDFNNLMTVIAGASDFLLKHPDLPRDKQLRYLQSIAETSQRATDLTNHLLAFGRRKALHPTVVDLGVRLDAFLEMVGRTLGSSICVELDLKASDARVEIDLTQLETALLNAVVNARDAMPDGGTLTLATYDCELHGQAAVCISIADTGTGIAQDALQRVFEPYFTTKDVGKGTGLGLSQIHGFAEQAGGRAEIESVEGEGTVLRIVLPRCTKPLSDMPGDASIEQLPRGLKLLLVEDNLQVRDFAADLLEDLNCEVVTADCGADALSAIAAHDFDLVFSDVVMPGMSGVDLAEHLAELRPGLPILLATGYAESLVGSRGEFTIVSKPYDACSLGRAISELLASRKIDGDRKEMAPS